MNMEQRPPRARTGYTDDTEVAARMRRAAAAGVVLDTWLDGQPEEGVLPRAWEKLYRTAEWLARQPEGRRALHPEHPMPPDYVLAAYREILTSSALHLAEERTGRRRVSGALAEETIRRFWDFAAREGLEAVGILYGHIALHENLNAIHYYLDMKREDFLHGRWHRPWTEVPLSPELELYVRTGLVEVYRRRGADVLLLTDMGLDALERSRQRMEASGELERRFHPRRWVRLRESGFHRHLPVLLPDLRPRTPESRTEAPIHQGARILGVGASSGRLALETGMAGSQGRLVVTDPSLEPLDLLRRQAEAAGWGRIETVQTEAGELPFPDGIFDAVVLVSVLPAPDPTQAVRGMARVVKPGGVVTGWMALQKGLLEMPVISPWFLPVIRLAERFGIPMQQHPGAVREDLEEAFRQAGLAEVRSVPRQGRVKARDQRRLLELMVTEGRLFRQILSRLPYAERRNLLTQMEEAGREWASSPLSTDPVECWPMVEVSGRVPHRGLRSGPR